MNPTDAKLNILASQLLTHKVETKLLAVCSITGIALTMDVPAILGQALTYENPLATRENFLPLANLSVTTLEKLDKVILAGLLLASIKYSHLLNSTEMSAAEQNIALQAVSSSVLIAGFKYYSLLPATLSVRKRDLPSLSLAILPSSFLIASKSTIDDVIKGHIIECSKIIFPPEEIKEAKENRIELTSLELIKQLAITRAKKSKELDRKELLVEARKIIASLKEEAVVNPKLLNLFKLLYTQEYILTAIEETKQLAMNALARYTGDAKALRLLAITKSPLLATNADSLFCDPLDIEVAESLEDVGSSEAPKLTMKEIIAKRKAELA